MPSPARIAISPNTGEAEGTSTRVRVATNAIFRGDERPFCVKLPVVGGRGVP